MAEFSLHEVIPGIHYTSDGVCNRGIIADNGQVLIVDSGISPLEARPLREAAAQYQKQGALALFNTHPHLDHVFGNEVFSDCPIIAHEGVRRTLLETGDQMVARVANDPQMAKRLGPINLTLPTTTFQEGLTLYIGKFEVQLIYFGVAHSPSDSIAWLPQSHTLFSGDLLFNALVPAAPPGGNLDHWIEALAQLEQLGAAQVIPGHGPVEPPAALGKLRAWFEMLRTQVQSAIKEGLDRTATIERVTPVLQAYAQRRMEERYPTVIGTAFDQYAQL